MATHVIWIRNDLRFYDNTALRSALNQATDKDRLLFIFYLDKEQFKIGSYSHDYFFSALNNFYKKCLKKGIDIYFLYGEVIETFNKLLNDFKDIKKVYFNIDESGYGYKRDKKVFTFLKENKIDVLIYNDHYLHSVKEILKKDNTYYKVFTPYYNNWIQRLKKEEKDINYKKLVEVTIKDFESKDLDARIMYHKLISEIKKDFSKFTGEKKARELLLRFVNEGLEDYHKKRDYPFLDSTSHLSCFLSTGQISIREVFNIVNKNKYSIGQETFIKELAWRDFYNMIHHYNQNQKDEEIIKKYRNILWSNDEDFFNLWKEGNTGFPIIDAAMRQLKKEGWMHNRLRMIVSSFLVKDLLIDWRLGERYFSEMLIDYDSSSNIGGWQWSASVGIDAQPYFRIFNPTIQSQKFDEEGLFIKKYVKELKSIPSKYIHEPYKYEKELRSQYGIEISEIYRKPIVNHKEQKLKALEMFNI
ncbi:MAG: deoxyribodipyrimidine photo-lyase [Bacilli bacterium]|nr:deoxyribodipyrimidine photo-lyase [Bacilli bacterium]